MGRGWRGHIPPTNLFVQILEHLILFGSGAFKSFSDWLHFVLFTDWERLIFVRLGAFNINANREHLLSKDSILLELLTSRYFP